MPPAQCLPRTWPIIDILTPGIVAACLGLSYLFGERWSADAPYYQAIALKAAREGHWWTLQQGSLPYFNKPPLAFWIHALFASAFGESPWVARLPELLFFAGVCVLVGAISRRIAKSPFSGLAAGLLMAFTYEWLFRIANFRLDFLLTLLLLAYAFFALRTTERGEGGVPRGTRGWGWLLAGTCLGLALLTKPFMGLVAPCAIALWLLVQKRLDRAARAWLLKSTALGVALALPWHIAMLAQHGRPFIDMYFLVQQWNRATGRMFDADPCWWYVRYFFIRDDGTPAWTTWPLLGLGALGAAIGVTRLARGRADAAARLALLGALWFFVWLLLLSCFADKRSYYLLVAYPGLALAGGACIAMLMQRTRASSTPSPHSGTRTTRALAVLACIAALAFAVLRPSPVEREALVARRADFVALTDFLRAHRARDILFGGLRYNDAALMYIDSGVWPRGLNEKEPMPRDQMPPAALAVYDTSPLAPNAAPRPAPDPRDAIIFSSGRFVITEIR